LPLASIGPLLFAANMANMATIHTANQREREFIAIPCAVDN